MTFVKVAAQPCRHCKHDSAQLIGRQSRPTYPIMYRIQCGYSACREIGPWCHTDTGAVGLWNEKQGKVSA